MSNTERLGVAALFAGAAIVALYFANSKVDQKLIDVPEVQAEAQFFGLNAGISYGKPGGALDMSPDIHFWAPGWSNSGTKLDSHPVVKSRHSYPPVTGGNLSSVIHYGWKGFSSRTPVSDNWRLNPPEAAVL